MASKLKEQLILMITGSLLPLLVEMVIQTHQNFMIIQILILIKRGNTIID